MNGIIRKMSVFDLNEVLLIEKISFKAKWTIDDFIYELIINKKADYFVYKINSVVIGYIGVWLLDGELHISNLAVDPSYRKKGIAIELVNQIIKMANSLNIRMISLEVRISNDKAIKLYKKIGFRKTDILENYYELEDGVRMVLEIGGKVNAGKKEDES
jgi:ribosomal-protein-alanine N-acetyltransferase